MPRALPGEPAAPGLGCSCSLPCSPDLPHGKAFSLQQALTRPPSSHKLPHTAGKLLSCSHRLDLDWQIPGEHSGFFTPCVPSREMKCLLQSEVLYTPQSHTASFAEACLIHGGDHEY